MEAVVHIECGLRAESSMSDAEAEERVRALLEVQSITVYRNGPIDLSDAEVLRSHALFVRVADVASAEGVGHWGATLHVHVFRLCDEGGLDEFVPGGSGGGEEVASSRQWELPSTDFDGLWGNLVFDAGVKERLVEYAATALLFAARGVSPHVVSVNELDALRDEGLVYHRRLREAGVSSRARVVIGTNHAADCPGKHLSTVPDAAESTTMDILAFIRSLE